MKAHAVDWRTPVALGMLTASGLLSALVSDGIGDIWSWIALAAPLVVAVLCIWRRPAVKPAFSPPNQQTDGKHQ
jgi:hypothetical protein